MFLVLLVIAHRTSLCKESRLWISYQVFVDGVSLKLHAYLEESLYVALDWFLYFMHILGVVKHALKLLKGFKEEIDI